MSDGVANKHRYPIWLASDDYLKLRFQTQSAILAVLIDHFESEHGDNPKIEEALPEIMHIVEQSWKKVRGRDIPIVRRKK